MDPAAANNSKSFSSTFCASCVTLAKMSNACLNNCEAFAAIVFHWHLLRFVFAQQMKGCCYTSTQRLRCICGNHRNDAFNHFFHLVRVKQKNCYSAGGNCCSSTSSSPTAPAKASNGFPSNKTMVVGSCVKRSALASCGCVAVSSVATRRRPENSARLANALQREANSTRGKKKLKTKREFFKAFQNLLLDLSQEATAINNVGMPCDCCNN